MKKDDKYAKSNIHEDSPTGKRARMHYIAMNTHGGGKAKMNGAGDKRTPGQRLYQAG